MKRLITPPAGTRCWVHGHDGYTNSPKGISYHGIKIINVNPRGEDKTDPNGFLITPSCVVLEP